jgi:hypothetical protein
MTKRKLLAIGLVAVMITIAGCVGGTGSQDTKSEDLGEDTNVDVSDTETGASFDYEMRATEKNHYGLVQKQSPFILDRSLERTNLIQRLQYLNDRGNTHHVYLLSHTGKVIKYDTARGKVSSVNSKLTNDKQIVKAPGCEFDRGSGTGSNGACYETVESPQLDGSYGTNGDAIFYFTMSGHYVEWNGLYVVSEEPLGINSQVTLVEEVGDDSIVNEDAEVDVEEDYPDINGTTVEGTANATSTAGA